MAEDLDALIGCPACSWTATGPQSCYAALTAELIEHQRLEHVTVHEDPAVVERMERFSEQIGRMFGGLSSELRRRIDAGPICGAGAMQGTPRGCILPPGHDGVHRLRLPKPTEPADPRLNPPG